MAYFLLRCFRES